MRSTPLAFLFVAATASAGTLDTPIVGGSPATAGQYPAVVAIEVGGGLCTGTLITPEWVLTAAHCVLPSELGLSSQAQVTAQLHIKLNTVNAFTGGQTIGAADSMPDPMFNINALGSHDCGLIKLAQPVTTITPTPINLDAAAAPVGIAVTQVGFGATNGQTQAGAGIENVVPQTSVSCTNFQVQDANLLCYNQTSGKGKCNGDSGGPSFAMIGGRQVQVGITSFGDQTCSQFGADTRVDAEKAFITAHVPNLYCATDADCQMGSTCFDNKCIITPFSPGGLGATCTSSTDCQGGTGTCGMGDGGGKCTMSCTPGQADSCPTGLDCLDNGGGQGLCWPPSSGGGCCDAGGAGAPTSIVGIGLVALVLRRRRGR